MNQTASFILSAFLLISASSLLSGCGGGGSGSSGGDGGSSAPYGSLTLSGTGASATGTTFNAMMRVGLSAFGLTTRQWYDNDFASGVTYPYIVLIVNREDSTGVVTDVSISRMISGNAASDQWVSASTPSPAAVSVSGTTIVFTNLDVPGYAPASTITTLRLNGTLSY